MNIHQISGDGQWEHFSKKGEKMFAVPKRHFHK